MKQREVFILWAKWIALVRGWRRDCVVGGMETRFKWRKAHSRTAKCEAFHVAPRLFFMFFVSVPPVFIHWTGKSADPKNGGLRKGIKSKSPVNLSIYRTLLRRERDSNPRNLSVQRFSRPPRSTTPPSLQCHLATVLSFDGCKVRHFYLTYQIFP